MTGPRPQLHSAGDKQRIDIVSDFVEGFVSENRQSRRAAHGAFARCGDDFNRVPAHAFTTGFAQLESGESENFDGAGNFEGLCRRRREEHYSLRWKRMDVTLIEDTLHDPMVFNSFGDCNREEATRPKLRDFCPLRAENGMASLTRTSNGDGRATCSTASGNSEDSVYAF